VNPELNVSKVGEARFGIFYHQIFMWVPNYRNMHAFKDIVPLQGKQSVNDCVLYRKKGLWSPKASTTNKYPKKIGTDKLLNNISEQVTY